MFIEAAILLITLAIGSLVGYAARDIKDSLRALQEAIKSRVLHEKTSQRVNEPKSLIVEALTPEQQAQKDLADRVKRLNQ